MTWAFRSDGLTCNEGMKSVSEIENQKLETWLLYFKALGNIWLEHGFDCAL